MSVGLPLACRAVGLAQAGRQAGNTRGRGPATSAGPTVTGRHPEFIRCVIPTEWIRPLACFGQASMCADILIHGIGPIHLSPEGAQYDSPGLRLVEPIVGRGYGSERQRPGNWDEINPSPEGAKQTFVAPLQGSLYLPFQYPGRCPGLLSPAPLGLIPIPWGRKRSGADQEVWCDETAS
jgi:hypothetical protein